MTIEWLFASVVSCVWVECGGRVRSKAHTCTSLSSLDRYVKFCGSNTTSAPAFCATTSLNRSRVSSFSLVTTQRLVSSCASIGRASTFTRALRHPAKRHNSVINTSIVWFKHIFISDWKTVTELYQVLSSIVSVLLCFVVVCLLVFLSSSCSSSTNLIINRQK